MNLDQLIKAFAEHRVTEDAKYPPPPKSEAWKHGSEGWRKAMQGSTEYQLGLFVKFAQAQRCTFTVEQVPLSPLEALRLLVKTSDTNVPFSELDESGYAVALKEARRTLEANRDA